MNAILLDAGRALLQVLVVGLLVGAGLPALFAGGMRALMIGRTVSADGASSEGRATPLGLAVAGLCFGVVLLAVLAGIVTIVTGHLPFTR